VFVVGCLGDWRSAAKVLFESESLCRDITPSREKRKGASDWPKDCASTLNASFGSKQGLENQHINSGAPLFTYGIPGNWIGRKAANGGNATTPMNETSPCLNRTDVHGVAHAFKIRGGCAGGGKGYLGNDNTAYTLSTNQDQHLFTEMRVRRITPMECERLQGFPDNYTNTPTSSDSVRYKALGNSMAVPVMKWIGQRINELS
jgi:DNA (cytosine-5)-methyltransferase 1